MSRARAKKILQSVQSLNSQYSEVTHDNITNPDSVLFQSNQFPKLYDDALIASYSHVATNSNSPLVLNDETLFDETQAHVFVEPTINQPEKGNSPSILNTDDVSELNFIVISNDEDNETNDIQFEYIHQYVDDDFDVSMIAPPDTLHTKDPSTDITEPTPSSSKDSAVNVSNPTQLSSEEPIVEVNEPTPSSLLNNVAKLVEYSDSSDSELEEPRVKRKKRCQVKKSEWNVEKNRLNREKGNEYFGKRKESGNWIKNICKPKKEIKPRCRCLENSNGVMKCHMIT
ncbi:hypothetical protein SFRURICE_012190 [Spodoptera frugiperda]|uniref:SFRICE_015052 n=1 Tax=Spodoptera frugiperda TaxID=7108 RepID=A0A2H1V542_SPOFR|nr:hypothetical protein SFRURICE_012190 [Spodoptera frugiperda]